jgi:hypothetical protein
VESEQRLIKCLDLQRKNVQYNGPYKLPLEEAMTGHTTDAIFNRKEET